ncbi:hypothetical protein HK104_010185 [Borealophlyctis nickersoniae]|nr:hypothetical protein HK104_010185 [Borealophlyctis nickersoniae]
MPELCNLRYDQVTFAATHNSGASGLKYDCHLLAKSCKAGRILCFGFEKVCQGLVPDAIEKCFWDNQDDSILKQVRLQNGIRSFDIDTCQVDDGSVVNCHGFDKARAIGGPIRPTFQSIATFLTQNRNEVITLTFGDHDGDTNAMAAFIKSALQDILGRWLVEKRDGEAWPTLGQMVDMDKRVVVMFSRGLDGDANGRPGWVLPYDALIDDPYFPVLEDDGGPTRLTDSYLNNWCLRDISNSPKLQVVDATISLRPPTLTPDPTKFQFPTRICLKDLAKQISTPVISRIADFCVERWNHVHRVRVDYYGVSDTVGIVRRLNERNVRVFGK